MQLQIKGKNVEMSDAIRSYAEEKLRKLERHLADPTKVELELSLEKNPSIADSHIVEATIWTKGPTLRARESSADWRASIDELVDKLERQAKRYQNKRRNHHPHGSSAPQLAREVATEHTRGTPVVPGEPEPMIVKMKQFPVKPMTPEEAVLQLELIGHDFFVFRNSEVGEVAVVYRRQDGNYGLIEPQP
ncbi:MAG: ribosome-associated translation inhibitor RaiA [Gaiellaceae bacterium]|jgi:putative sigma-54 modulation protein